jgi:hypothetical protein
MKWVIFDLDGTVACSKHRSHHIALDIGTKVTHDSGSTGVIQSLVRDDPCGQTVYEILWDKCNLIRSPHEDVERWRNVDWDAWDADTLKDGRIEAVIHVLEALRAKSMLDGDEVGIMFLTARGERARSLTEQWLAEHDLFHPEWGDVLVMRGIDDGRRDTIIKRELIERMRDEGHEFLFAFEDRRLVANMLRELGIFVFHVADYD